MQLEEALSALKDAEVTSQKQAAALASGEDEHPQSGLAELRARHQVRRTDYRRCARHPTNEATATGTLPHLSGVGLFPKVG